MSRSLIEKLERCTGPDNELDIAIEIALFEPDEEFGGVRANAAGTKVVYMRHDDSCQSHWAFDWTLNEENRKAAIAELERLYP